MRIEFHPEASQELSDAADWYVSQSPGAARDFAVQMERALDKIVVDPQRFANVGAKFRACSVTRFPFQIVFRVDPHRIYVIAIAHAKRRPRYWRRRTSGEPKHSDPSSGSGVS